MRLASYFAIASLFLCFPVLAQSPMPVDQVCGPPGTEVTTNQKIDLDAKAQTLLKIGSGELKGTAENYKKEIMLGANTTDSARAVFYLNRISCVLIYQDQKLSTDEKLQRIQVLQGALKVSEEKSWDSPKVVADMNEAHSQSLLNAGKTAAVGANGCFSPPDVTPQEKGTGNWRFMWETAAVETDQFTCNSGQANVGAATITSRAETKICLDVFARPAQQGVYHCNTSAHVKVKLTRPST